ncbi:MAG TPA: hypothetical protein VD971_11670 [Phycisphaerales bacterium]|nr:hypothetical protein [Phycisphaerales bacterium]
MWNIGLPAFAICFVFIALGIASIPYVGKKKSLVERVTCRMAAGWSLAQVVEAGLQMQNPNLGRTLQGKERRDRVAASLSNAAAICWRTAQEHLQTDPVNAYLLTVAFDNLTLASMNLPSITGSLGDLHYYDAASKQIEKAALALRTILGEDDGNGFVISFRPDGTDGDGMSVAEFVEAMQAVEEANTIE